MPQIYAVLTSGQRIPLSTRISTSFFSEGVYRVSQIFERYPRSYHRYLNGLGVVPNWNSYSTLETLTNYLNDYRVGTIVLNPIQSLGSGQPMLVGRRNLYGFILE